MCALGIVGNKGFDIRSKTSDAFYVVLIAMQIWKHERWREAECQIV